MNTIADNIKKIQQCISKAEQQYHRQPGSVNLLAVSKTHSIEKIRAAYAVGLRHFGENYMQEALQKITQLAELDIQWHFIGPIQSNKTRAIAENFDWVHSVDRYRIAERLNQQRPDTLDRLNILIQVNISDEKSKSGIAIAELSRLANQMTTLPNLRLRGLMAIPKATQHFRQQRAIFHELHQIYQQLKQQGLSLDTLSMGMSDDFIAGIAEGSTLTRIGTAIFGSRQYRHSK